MTDDDRAGRRAAIMAAAAGCFAADGFHTTSMADIIRASGLSAGAVYSYFRSKEELITAVAGLPLANAEAVFAALPADDAAPSPAEAVAALVQGVVARAADDPALGVDITRLAVQVWGEALRNPEVRGRVSAVYRTLRDHCTEVARRWQAAGNLPPEARPDEVGAAMLGLAQGFLLQRLLLDEATAEGYIAGATAVLAH